MTHTQAHLDATAPTPATPSPDWRTVPLEEYEYKLTKRRCPLMAGEQCMGRECALCVQACVDWHMDAKRRKYKRTTYRCSLQRDDGAVEVHEPREV